MVRALLFLAALVLPFTGKAEDLRPNILFLFSDDQRADTIAALGNPNIRTPNLDRLVKEGTTFTRAYCMGGMQGAICVPSRAMLMSSRTLFHLDEKLQQAPTWPEAFGKAGYRTFATGKWHNSVPGLARSFQEGRAVFLGGMTDPHTVKVADLENGKMVRQRPAGKHATELFADNAIAFLKDAPKDRPWLCYTAFTSPHDPRVAPEEIVKPYLAEPPPLPPNFLPEHPFNNGELKIRDEMLAPFPRTEKEVRRHLAEYYACITHLDSQIGRILEALDATGQLDRTLIVFSSDHGLAIGSHGLLGKQNLYDHSMHAPLIFSGPGISKGQKTSALCYLLDIYPTLGELAKVTGPSASEGRSLIPALKDPSVSGRDGLLTAYRNVQRAYRDDRWKVIRYPQIGRTQFFDLETDPAEQHDLAQDPHHAERVEAYTAKLIAAQKAAGDTLPFTVAKPNGAQ